MSFLKRLFGSGESKPEEKKVAGEAEHKGFLIQATPFKQDGQWQLCGVISREIDGVVKEHRFIRADRFASLEDIVSTTLNKGRVLVDQEGERLFK